MATRRSSPPRNRERLTGRQRLFVEHYCRTGKAETAALAAGYSKTTARAQASRLLANVGVALEMERRMKRLAMTTDEIVRRIAWEADNAPNSGDRVRALGLLAKIHGMFKDEVQDKTVTIRVEGPGVVQIQPDVPDVQQPAMVQ